MAGPRRYLLVGVRRQPRAVPRPHGPYDTSLLADDQARVLVETTAAALEVDWHAVRSRDRFVLTVFDGRVAHRLVEAPQQVHGEGPVPALFKLVWNLKAPMLSAAAALATLCDLIAAADPGLDGRGFLVALGDQAAGITPGRAGWADLTVGGHNVLLGGGFRADLDDGSPTQVRHFAGTAAAVERLGGTTTRIASRLRGDLPGTADDRLTAAAIGFARELRTGRLRPAQAGGWVRRHLLDDTAG